MGRRPLDARYYRFRSGVGPILSCTLCCEACSLMRPALLWQLPLAAPLRLQRGGHASFGGERMAAVPLRLATCKPDRSRSVAALGRCEAFRTCASAAPSEWWLQSKEARGALPGAPAFILFNTPALADNSPPCLLDWLPIVRPSTALVAGLVDELLFQLKGSDSGADLRCASLPCTYRERTLFIP